MNKKVIIVLVVLAVLALAYYFLGGGYDMPSNEGNVGGRNTPQDEYQN